MAVRQREMAYDGPVRGARGERKQSAGGCGSARTHARVGAEREQARSHAGVITLVVDGRNVVRLE